MTMKSATKVTRKYQVTIPKKVRKKAGVEVGDEFEVAEKDGLIVLQKKKKEKNLLMYAGSWKGYPEDSEALTKDLRKLWSSWKA
jgi:AbrB family looped-hinge helix DNA binding protein